MINAGDKVRINTPSMAPNLIATVKAVYADKGTCLVKFGRGKHGECNVKISDCEVVK